MGIYNLKIHKGVSKKTGKEYEALQLTIGEYKTLIFPSPFEMMYIKKRLLKKSHDDFVDNSGDDDESEDELDDF